METTKPTIIIKTPKEDQILIDRNIGYIKKHDSDSFIAACKRYEDCFMFGQDEYFKVLEEYPNDKIFTYITDELKYRKFHGRIFNAVKFSDFHEVTRLITEEKVDVHFFKDLATRLACIMNNKAMVDHLITFGADPSKIDHCIACAVDKYQDIDFIKYLQSLGCTITENELKRAWECKRYKDKTKRRKMLSYLSSQIKMGEK